MDNSTLTGVFTNIANAIRTKLGTQTTMTPAQMPTQIASIPSGGQMATAKVGVTIDNLIGNINNGILYKPSSGDMTLGSNEITLIASQALQHIVRSNEYLVGVSFPNLTTINSGGMQYACSYCGNNLSVSMPKLATIQSSGLR